ncbi:MAG TPA: dethiobiotin synthase [Thermoanaerobaculia bacterium]
MSLAVVGTGTEVGKTVVSAVLLAHYVGSGALAYWKPVATGSRDGRDAETVARLAPATIEILPESYLFREPLSPHLAARLEGTTINPARLLADLASHRAAEPRLALVVEGVGGLLVPLTDDGHLLIDWLAAAGLPCLLVAASGLGTINHTLLSLEALRARGIEVAGVVLNGPLNAENRAAIERFGQATVVAELAPLAPLDAETIARAAAEFDREGRLAPHLERA